MNDTIQSTGASDTGSVDLFANDAASQQSANNGNDRGASNEPNQTTQSQQGDKVSASSASNSTADQSKPGQQQSSQDQNQTKDKFVSRGEKREQEIKTALADLKREREEFRREREALTRQQNPNQQQNQVQEPVFVDKPKTPQFTREQITAEYNKAKAEGNEAVMQACVQANQEWDRYDNDLKFWKIENGQKVEKFNSYRKHYWNEAVKRFPDLQNQDSEMYREAKSLASKFPEVLNRQTADGEYLIAQLAGMRIERKGHAAALAARDEQIKTLTEKLNATQKRLQPASQGVAPSISKAGEGSTPEERLAQRIDQAKAA
jgi:hypothetical protein